LVSQAGGTVVGIAFLMELSFLGGRDKLPDLEIRSLLTV
jgi:adenine phosphoribosyltransferase